MVDEQAGGVGGGRSAGGGREAFIVYCCVFTLANQATNKTTTITSQEN